MSDKAKVAVQLTLEGASQFTRGLSSLGAGFGRVRTNISTASADLFHFMQIGKDIFALGQRMGGGSVSLANALLGPNEAFEVASMQFEQLLGSADAASERIKLLYDYANNTSFLNPDVLLGGKRLQAFGGDALGAGTALKMTGDMAAYADTQFAEIAIWVGRAYSAINSGKPFGEAAQRLQELTLLSGEERAHLEDMAAAGATGNEVWAEFQRIMDKTAGTAKRLSNSYRGAKSTIAGLYGEVKRLTGAKLFDQVRGDVLGLRDDISGAFDAGRVQAFADTVGTAIAEMYTRLKGNSLGEGFSLTTIFNAAEAGKLSDLLTVVVKGAGANFGIALHNAAREHGPAIQRMLIPQRLHRILGISKERQDALEQMRKTGDVGGALGAMDYASLGGGMMFSGAGWSGDPDRDKQIMSRVAQVYAGLQLGEQRTRLPYVDIAEAIKQLGISDTAKAPASAPAGPSVAEQAATAMAERLNRVSDILAGMEISTKRVADNLEIAAEAAF